MSALTSWRPVWSQFNDFFDEVERATPRAFTPAVDIDESDEHYVLSFDLPGVTKQDLEIEFEGGRLTVSGERKHEKTDLRSRFSERRVGRFQRSFTLPQGIKAEQLEAKYDNGVLSVSIPKAAEAKKAKIQIGDGKSGFLKNLTATR